MGLKGTLLYVDLLSRDCVVSYVELDKFDHPVPANHDRRIIMRKGTPEADAFLALVEPQIEKAVSALAASLQLTDVAQKEKELAAIEAEAARRRSALEQELAETKAKADEGVRASEEAAAEALRAVKASKRELETLTAEIAAAKETKAKADEARVEAQKRASAARVDAGRAEAAASATEAEPPK